MGGTGARRGSIARDRAAAGGGAGAPSLHPPGRAGLVLGIDPGSLATGYGLVRRDGDRLTAVDFGIVAARSAPSFPQRLRRIFDALRRLMAEHRPDAAAVEGGFFARNPQSALKLGQARGVALVAAALEGVPVFEYAPRQVKGAVSGFGGAEKRQVQAMVKALLGLEELPAPPDAADALALAICHHRACALGGRLRTIWD